MSSSIVDSGIAAEETSVDGRTGSAEEPSIVAILVGALLKPLEDDCQVFSSKDKSVCNVTST